MDELKSKVAYLQGLSSGMNLNQETTEGKLLQSIIGVLSEFADSFEELEDYIESIDEDLSTLENQFYTDDIDFVEVECPRCGEVVCFNPEVLDDDNVVEVTCPNCNEVVFVNDLQFAGEPKLQEHTGELVEELAEDEDI